MQAGGAEVTTTCPGGGDLHHGAADITALDEIADDFFARGDFGLELLEEALEGAFVDVQAGANSAAIGDNAVVDAAQSFTNFFHDEFRPIRLKDERLEAEFSANRNNFALAEGRAENDFERPQVGIGANFFQELEAGHAGHHDIEDSEAWPEAVLKKVPGFLAIFGHGDVEVHAPGEQVFHEVPAGFVIFGDKNRVMQSGRKVGWRWG